MKPKFDSTISLRTMLMSAVVAYLASSKFALPAEVVTALGAAFGVGYDLLAFYVKRFFTRLP